MQGTSDPNLELLDAMAMCGHLVAHDSVHWFLAEHRERLFPDDMFADLFSSGRGRPSVPADVVATVMVLQALEGLSDREAIGQLRMNIAWKVAAGRPLHDEGFHPTVLTLWRNKLRASDGPQRIFDAVREHHPHLPTVPMSGGEVVLGPQCGQLALEFLDRLHWPLRSGHLDDQFQGVSGRRR